jgi:hypothetical protein
MNWLHFSNHMNQYLLIRFELNLLLLLVWSDVMLCYVILFFFDTVLRFHERDRESATHSFLNVELMRQWRLLCMWI